LQGNVTQINRAFEKMFGWSIEETISCPLLHIPEYIQAEYNMLVANMLQGATIADYETVRLTKDGRIIDVSITISPIRNENGTIVAIASISRNITARKHTEEVLRRSEKLSVVGQLAAGVAHEIRNPLTTLRGFVQLQKTKGPLSESILNVMLSELDRINFIVSEFLVLAKPQINYFQLVDVRDLLRDIILLLDSHANMINVAIETNYMDPLPHVKGEPNQLKQVFINVLKNGMESMPDGGTMSIEVLYNADEHYVSIHFIDHGCGISEDQLKRLGEPFFTSKETGNGLGLMVSQQIIANHKGSIHTQSELNKGTCVEIRLPVVLREAIKS
jgi:two-component system, sporulation sensor kinase E